MLFWLREANKFAPATGDCTGFVAKLFGLRQIDEAKKIREDFGLRLFDKGIAAPIKITPKLRDDFNEWLNEARTVVFDYLNRLEEWRRVYAPCNPAEPFHPLFVESLMKTDYVEYLADMLAHGTAKEKQEFYENGKAEIEKIRKRLDNLADVQRFEKSKAI